MGTVPAIGRHDDSESRRTHPYLYINAATVCVCRGARRGEEDVSISVEVERDRGDSMIEFLEWSDYVFTNSDEMKSITIGSSPVVLLCSDGEFTPRSGMLMGFDAVRGWFEFCAAVSDG